MNALDGTFSKAHTKSAAHRLREDEHAQNEILQLPHRRLAIKCLVHDIQELPPAFHGVAYVFDAEEEFDVILASCREHTRSFAQCSNPAAPLIALSDGFGPRADAVVREPTAAALTSAFSSVLPVIEQLVKLPRVPSGIDRNGLLALTLSYTRNRTIEAQWQPSQAAMVHYPLLVGIVDPRSLLEEMANAGLLRRHFFERLHVCEQCQSSRLHAREVCVACRSSHLAEHSLVHHYACGFQAPQPSFEHREGYLCPKCRKQLRHYGVDYDKPGKVTSCKSCGESMAEPEVGFVCLDCGGYTSGERAGHVDWYHYDLLPDGITALRSGALPHSDLVECSGRLSLRDFHLLADHSLQVAQRHDRPLTAWRATLDMEDLTKTVGPRGLLEICQLIRDVVSDELHSGDVVAALPTGFVVCLPESNRKRSDMALRSVKDRIAEVVHPKIKISVETFEGDNVAALLRELH